MAHVFEADDQNIIKKCQDYGFCCTYDTAGNFNYKSVKDAIAAVLESRAKQSKKLEEVIARTDGIVDPLHKLIRSAEELARISDNGIGLGTSQHDAAESYQNQLEKEKERLDTNLHTLRRVKKVMDRKNIRVPVVGVINSGKSTFLHSALGGGMSDGVKENLFPSAGAHKSCTGTRTVLIYDNHSEGVRVDAKFKDKLTFLNNCSQSARRMTKVLKNLEIADQFTELKNLQKNLTDKSDPIALLKGYCQSGEFKRLCKIQYKNERDAESVQDFCSFVYFSNDQDYSEDQMESGLPKNTFSVSGLVKSWEEGTGYSVPIPSDNDFESVKNFVCKYDPGMKNAKHYTTYCGVQVVEIRGNLCEEIAGLELIDSVGANDDAISNEAQMKTLMQDSDAMILLERPQPQNRDGWSVSDCIDFVRKQQKVPGQFLYLTYNCYDNNTKIPSDLSHDLDTANKYHSGQCKRIYVSDIGEWEEVQSKMLVDMLVHLSDSVEETHKEYLDQAENAKAAISGSILSIRQSAEGLGQMCAAEDENASEKNKEIEKIFQQLFGEVEKLTFEIQNEDNTTLRGRANNITEKMAENLKPGSASADFNVAYEWVSPIGPRYMYNRYVAFLCMYSRMLEDVKRQYNTLKNDINKYVEEKRKALLGILWEKGRFQCIMSDIGSKDGSVLPHAAEVCGWLKRDARELLADVLEELLLQDIGAESLIDGSIGKVIEQFNPKNLTAEQLFGRQISDPALEDDENVKAAAIEEQLKLKAEELKAALFESVVGTAENLSGAVKTMQENAGRKKVDDNWDDFLDKNSKNNTKEPGSEPVQNIPPLNGNIFDLDKKVRNDVVCDGILKKFRDKLRGDGLPQNAELPISQLYNLYDHYYDELLTHEEASHKKRLSDVRHNTDKLAKQLISLCQN